MTADAGKYGAQRTEGLFFLPQRFECAHHLPAAFEILAKRFFNNNAVGALLRVAVVLELLCYDGKDAWWQGHVKEPVLFATTLLLDFVELVIEVLEALVLVVLPVDVGAVAQEFFHQLLALIRVHILDVLRNLSVEGFFVHLGTCVADDVSVLR